MTNMSQSLIFPGLGSLLRHVDQITSGPQAEGDIENQKHVALLLVPAKLSPIMTILLRPNSSGDEWRSDPRHEDFVFLDDPS